MKTKFRGLYGITSRAFGMSHLDSARAFLDGGFRIVQYREKEAPADLQIKEAGSIRDLCAEYGADFVVNDRVDVAVAIDARIVHVGQEDMRIDDVRCVFRGDVGVSASSVEEAVLAEKKGAAYLGVGTIFRTSTKTDGSVIGVYALSEIRKHTVIPIIAIGGITADTLQRIKSAGADGVAVISAVLAAEDPVAAARELVRRWEEY
jgi:thiamine-phosphate pyrophosphorylase